MPYKKHLGSIKKLGLTSSGILVSQVLNLAFIPVLSRLYKPEDFAAFGFFLAVTVLLSGVASLKYQDAISTPFSTATTNSLTKVAFLLAISVILLVTPFLLFIYKWIFDSYLLGIYAILSATSIAIANIGVQRLIKDQKYSVYTLIIFFLMGAGPLLQTTLAFSPYSGLILGVTISHLIAALLALFVIQKNVINIFSLTLRDRAAIRLYKTFPLYALPNFFLLNLRMKLPYYSLTTPANALFMGFYAQSDRLLGAPTTLFTIAFRPLATEAILSSKRKMVELFLHYLKLQWYSLLPILALFMVFTHKFVIIVLGKDWAGATDIMQSLSIPAFLMMTTTWLDRFYDFLKSHRTILKLEVLGCLLALVCLIYLGMIRNDSLLAIKWFSGLLSLYYLCWIINLAMLLKIKPLQFLTIILSAACLFAFTYLALTYLSQYLNFVALIILTIALSGMIALLIKLNE